LRVSSRLFVSFCSCLVRLLLLLQLAVDLAHAQPAAFAQPQRVLQQRNQNQQGNRKPAHGKIKRLESNCEVPRHQPVAVSQRDRL